MKRSFSIRFLFVILSMLVLVSCGKKPQTWQEQYDLGIRYLSDGNYEEAIIAFTAAIEIDPQQIDGYISLAEAYREQGQYDLALEILQRGYDATGSDLLFLHLNAEEANQILLNDVTFGQTLTDLFDAFEEGNRDAAAELLDEWIQMTGHDPYQRGGEEIDCSGLLYDGTQFTVSTEENALIFKQFDKVYYGAQVDGIPQGTGVMVTVYTWYPEGGIGYYWVEGSWEQGSVIGNAKIWDDYSPAYQRDKLSYKEITCTFGQNELISTGRIIERWDSDGQTHQFSYQVHDGSLVPSEWSVDSSGRGRRPCDIHSGCGMSLSGEGIGSETYQYPFSWYSDYPENYGSLYGEHISLLYSPQL